MNRSGTYVNQPTNYKAFIPNPLPPHPALILEGELSEKLAKASTLLARLDGMAYTLPNTHLFIYMYGKKEALLSSQIEGTQATLEDIFEFESGTPIKNEGDVTEVINYIKALDYGIERLETLPLSLRLIKELHAIILSQKSDISKPPGEFRRSQNWIGAPGSTLKDAIFVPPPPHEALKAMGDLEKYLHTQSPLPELVNCALMHYQFETIHPFLDGNGRVGRLLVTFYLYWKGVLEKPLLYLSYYFKKNRQEYYDRLRMVSETGNYEQWIKFFLEGIIKTSESAIATTKNILNLQEKDQRKLYTHTSSIIAVQLLDHLFYVPILSVQTVQQVLKISYPSANKLIADFIKIGIVKEVTGKKRDKRYAYSAYLDILSEGTQPL